MKPIYIFLALFIAFIWGAQTVIHKHLLKRLSGTTIMLISTFLFLFIILFISYFERERIHYDLVNLTNTDFILLVILLTLMSLFSRIIYYDILKRHESSLISSIICCAPLFTLLIAYLFLEERIKIQGILGVISIVIGVILISYNHSSTIGDFSIINKFQK